MTSATLQHFRNLAEAMQAEPANWQWIGPHLSQRMFGITRARAEAYAARHGGKAEPETCWCGCGSTQHHQEAAEE